MLFSQKISLATDYNVYYQLAFPIFMPSREAFAPLSFVQIHVIHETSKNEVKVFCLRIGILAPWSISTCNILEDERRII
jgi:hypothetical protein